MSGENEKTTAQQKQHKGSSHICQKHLDDPPQKLFCGLKRQKLNFMEGLSPATSDIRITGFPKKHLTAAVRRGVMV